MEISTERELIDKGREILESCLPEIEKTPGYLGWRMVETADFLPRPDKEIEVRSLFLLVAVDGDANFKEVAEYIETVEEKAYDEFASLVMNEEIEGTVNIFIFIDMKEET